MTERPVRNKLHGPDTGQAGRVKIVFFAPHSAMWVHSFPEAVVAEALAQAGHDIVYVGCGRAFSRQCVCMTAAGITPDATEEAKSAVCDHCVSRKNILLSEFGFRSYDISDVLHSQQLAAADELLAGVTPDNFLDLKIEGVEVGRAALSTYLLIYKRSRLQFSGEEWSDISGRAAQHGLFGIGMRQSA